MKRKRYKLTIAEKKALKLYIEASRKYLNDALRALDEGDIPCLYLYIHYSTLDTDVYKILDNVNAREQYQRQILSA